MFHVKHDLVAYASRPHYADHLAPVWDALGRPPRLYGIRDVLGHPAMAERCATALQRGQGPMIVAGWTDLFRARRLGYGPFVRLQHGIGQSYAGDERAARNTAYAGGAGHEDVRLFVVPGPDPAARWSAAYPEAAVVMAGDIRRLPARDGPPDRTIAVTFHWPLGLIPETRTAWYEYRAAVAALPEAGWHVLGHWHPRWDDILRGWYEGVGIEPVASLDEVARRADVLVADNTSALYEFAATDRPVVVLDSRHYRPGAQHGLRFWEAADVGIRISDPARLAEAVARAYADPAGLRAGRHEALGLVFAPGDAQTAAEAIAAMM